MANIEELKEKLSLYLSSLSDGAQQLLLRTLQKNIDAGDVDPSSQLIMDALQSILKPQEKPISIEPHIKQAFFKPAHYFMSPVNLVSISEGRISQASLDAIWAWIKRDMVSEQERALITEEVAEIEDSEVEEKAAKLRSALMPKITGYVQKILKELAGEQKLANQLGSDLIYGDLRDFLASTEKYTALSPYLSKIQKPITSWASPEGEEAYASVNRFMQQYPMQAAWIFSGLGGMLSDPKLRVQMTVRLAGSDDAVQVGATVYAPGVNQLLAEMEGYLATFEAQISQANGMDQAVQALGEWRKIVRAVETELELPAQCAWTKSIASMKTYLSQILEKQISPVASLIRKALRAPKDGTAEVADENLLQDAAHAAELFHHAERMKDSLAINEPVRKIRKELDQTFEILTTSLVERTRNAQGDDVETCKTLGNAAVLFATHLVDEEYAGNFRRQLKAAAAGSDMKIAIPA